MSTLSAEEKYRNFIPQESLEYLEKLFAGFKRTVTIEVYTAEGEHREYNEFTLNICRAFNVLSDKIELREYAADSEMAEKRKIIATPTVLISPDEYDIRFLGAPAGEEGRALVEALNLASMGIDAISDSTKETLEPLNEERQIKIFASQPVLIAPDKPLTHSRPLLPDRTRFQLGIFPPSTMKIWPVNIMSALCRTQTSTRKPPSPDWNRKKNSCSNCFSSSPLMK